MVESPSPYLHLTGRENLEVHTRLLGLTPRVIDETLDAVDLLPVASKLRATRIGENGRIVGPFRLDW